MVFVTLPLARTAPKASKIAAIIIAVLIDRIPEPTEIPIAFATSLAPIAHAIKKPITEATAIITIPFSSILTYLLHLFIYVLIRSFTLSLAAIARDSVNS